MDKIQKELIKAGRKDLAEEYYNKVASRPPHLKDHKNFKESKGVQIPESEAKSLVEEFKGKLVIPELHKTGPIKFNNKKIGYANDFSGIIIEDKNFIKKYVKDFLYYIH